MQKIYDLLVMLDESENKTKITPKELMELLNKLGDKLESTILTDEPCDGDSLQSKIKELLRLLGCSLSDKQLNQILKGELSLDDALSKQAKIAWLMIFEKDEDGKSRPNREIVEHMMWCTQSIAAETLEIKLQRSMKDYRTQLRINEKTRAKTIKRYEDPILLDRKRDKLRLYIAHMQGYDKDRDRDGGRGIDPNTGIVIDFGDIYIADKQHGAIIEDIERNGIDMSDIH